MSCYFLYVGLVSELDGKGLENERLELFLVYKGWSLDGVFI